MKEKIFILLLLSTMNLIAQDF